MAFVLHYKTTEYVLVRSDNISLTLSIFQCTPATRDCPSAFRSTGRTASTADWTAERSAHRTPGGRRPNFPG